MADFRWTKQRNEAAIALADGRTRRDVCQEYAIPERTLYNWLAHPDFAAEVDRLSLMTGIASRAERLRIAKRVARQLATDDSVTTDKDLLDWLKFAQSETDGIKLDAAKFLAALGDDASSSATD